MALCKHTVNRVMPYKTSSHSKYNLQAHIIFVKYRERKLTNEVLITAEAIIRRECLKLKSDLVAFNGESDHVHLVVSYTPTISISRLVQILKSMTGRELKLHHPYLNQVAWRRNALWSSGYFACSVGGAPLEF
ncbi:IS200/IS605 family transposase [Maribrevibacterium harenarium]|uniref:IS200/IS605 family transposase n=1 Tax=Maribrevibacterium harenarium TaxID=2589817 RepID=UPI002E2527BE